MVRNLVIVVLLAIVAFFLSRHEEQQVFEKDMEQTKSTIENIYQAETAEESQKYVEEHNTRAKQEMVIMKQRAKSPESIKFTELTEQQNGHADDATRYTNQFLPLSKKIEGLDPNTTDPDLINEMFTDLCNSHKNYLNSLGSIQEILTEKVNMVNKFPVILQEIVGGSSQQQEQVKSVLQLMLDNQSKILLEERQAHIELQCPQFLANTTDI